MFIICPLDRSCKALISNFRSKPCHALMPQYNHCHYDHTRVRGRNSTFIQTLGHFCNHHDIYLKYLAQKKYHTLIGKVVDTQFGTWNCYPTKNLKFPVPRKWTCEFLAYHMGQLLIFFVCLFVFQTGLQRLRWMQIYIYV